MTIQALFALISGGIIGTFFGATGGGGSLMAIPLLVYVVGVPVQSATAMSLVVVGFSAFFGAWRAGRDGKVRGLAALLFSATGAIGAWIGAYGHQLVHGNVVLLLFGILMGVIAIVTWHRSRSEIEGPLDEGCAVEFSFACMGKALSIGFGVGLLTGFFGIGGGFVIVPGLVLIMGFPMRIAIGTSLLIIGLISLGGIAGHLSLAKIDGVLTTLVLG